jgi:hypothetical protein
LATPFEEKIAMGTHKTRKAIDPVKQTPDTVKPTTTFSGRTDVDATSVVKHARAKKVLEQLKVFKNKILTHSPS